MQDNEKIKEIYEKHWKRLMRTAYRELGDYDMSQDVVQDVLLKFAMMTNVDSSKEQGLLVSMVKNKARDYRRKYCKGNTVSMSGEELELEKHGNFGGLEERHGLEYDCEELGSRVFQELKKKNIVWYEIMAGLYIYRDERRKFGKEYQEMGIISDTPESKK